MLKLLLRNAQASAFSIVTELFLPRLIFIMDRGMGPGNRLDLEQAIHRLEWDTLGLWNQEVDEWDRQDHHGCEEVVDAAARLAHAVEHLRREAGDDEVPEPSIRLAIVLSLCAKLMLSSCD